MGRTIITGYKIVRIVFKKCLPSMCGNSNVYVWKMCNQFALQSIIIIMLFHAGNNS